MKAQLRIERAAETLLLSVSLLIRRLRQTRDDTLSMPETSALSRLDHGGPATVTALARLERISAQSLGATLAALEARAFVRRNEDPGDGRQSMISITRRGRETLRSRRSARAKQLAAILSTDFSDDDIELLLAAAPLLERLANAI